MGAFREEVGLLVWGRGFTAEDSAGNARESVIRGGFSMDVLGKARNSAEGGSELWKRGIVIDWEAMPDKDEFVRMCLRMWNAETAAGWTEKDIEDYVREREHREDDGFDERKRKAVERIELRKDCENYLARFVRPRTVLDVFLRGE